MCSECRERRERVWGQAWNILEWHRHNEDCGVDDENSKATSGSQTKAKLKKPAIMFYMNDGATLLKTKAAHVCSGVCVCKYMSLSVEFELYVYVCVRVYKLAGM